jgi:hypothetical protein
MDQVFLLIGLEEIIPTWSVKLTFILRTRDSRKHFKILLTCKAHESDGLNGENYLIRSILDLKISKELRPPRSPGNSLYSVLRNSILFL